MSAELKVELGKRSYPIIIGSGLLDEVGRLCREALPARTALVVTDTNVGPLYAERVRDSLTRRDFETTLHTVPAGETSKSRERLFEIYDAALDARLDRRSLIVALGGGVVGDLAGFAAATFLRGIAYVQVPTTLLAMVDSSVGGKTGINLPQGKNLVGAFHQPRAVVADLHTLATLPTREYRAGLAEVVKYGVIRDADLFAELENHAAELLDRNDQLLEKIIRRCCAVKADVVASDERESGLRAILNFGHTLGHALENLEGYGKLLHGEAVALGMVYAALLSEKITGLPHTDTIRLAALLRSLGLLEPIPPRPWPEIAARMNLDKKVARGRPHFVLAEKIGRVRPGHPLADHLLEDTWHSLETLLKGGADVGGK